MGFIYCWRNQINNKLYIGQTKRTVKIRWQQHLEQTKYNIKHDAFHNAIRKYGADKFILDWVYEIDNQYLSAYEINYIKIYNSKTPNGYNMTDGGEAGTGRLPGYEIDEKLLRIYKILDRDFNVIFEGHFKQLNKEYNLQYDCESYRQKARSKYKIFLDNYFIIRDDEEITEDMKSLIFQIPKDITLKDHSNNIKQKKMTDAARKINSSREHTAAAREARKIPIAIVNESGEVINTYNSIVECADNTGVGKSQIGGYIKDEKYHKVKRIGFKCKFIKL